MKASSAFAQLEGALNGAASGSDESNAILARSFAIPDVPDEGFLTSEQWAREWGCSVSHAMGKLARMTAAGEMERRVYRLQKLTRLYPVPHYASRKA